MRTMFRLGLLSVRRSLTYFMKKTEVWFKVFICYFGGKIYKNFKKKVLQHILNFFPKISYFKLLKYKKMDLKENIFIYHF